MLRTGRWMRAARGMTRRQRERRSVARAASRSAVLGLPLSAMRPACRSTPAVVGAMGATTAWKDSRVILPTPLARATANGRKTTHRQPPNHTVRPGQRIPIRADGEHHCHIEVLAVHQDTLRDLTREHAAQEGFAGARGPLNFRRYWLERYDKAWSERQHGSDGGLTDEAVAARFNTRHVGLPVVVIEWRVTDAPNRFLAAGSRGGDYTGIPARAVDPLPVVDPSPADVKRAREQGERQRESFRRDLEAERARRKRERIPELREAERRRKDAA
jgi:uncharacterized protein YhfF